LAAWLLVGLGVTGWAETTATHFKVQGDTVAALFQATDPNPCVEFQVGLIASDEMLKLSPDGGPETRVQTVLVVAGTDICENIDFVHGTGSTEVQAAFHVTGNLSTAALRATVPVFDLVSQQVINFDVNLTWTATGKPVVHHGTETIRDEDLDIFVTAHFPGKLAPAVASGTVVAFGVNFTPEPSVRAEIQTQNDGIVTIQMAQ
jgi:hypothetical protein